MKIIDSMLNLDLFLYLVSVVCKVGFKVLGYILMVLIVE